MSNVIDICVICGKGPVHEIERTRHLHINNADLSVSGDRIMKCHSCEELFYTGRQAKEADKKLADARRVHEGLLTSEQIRKCRLALTLSQAQLEAALGVGAKTVVRWENGTAVQGKAIDDVLRLISLDPDNLRLLVHIRHSAFASQVDKKLTPQDHLKAGELKEAVYATLERCHFASDEEADHVADEIVNALRIYKQEKIRRIASGITSAIA